jgi:hypothetical protein
LQAPRNASGIARGEAFTLLCEIKNDTGKNIPAVLPFELTLTAGNGLSLPGSGFYAAEQGKFLLKETLPSNLPADVKDFSVVIRCLSSGKTASITLPVSTETANKGLRKNNRK